MEKLSFEEAMLFESTKSSPELAEIMKLIEESEELTESSVIAALAAKLGLEGTAGISTSIFGGGTAYAAGAIKSAGALAAGATTNGGIMAGTVGAGITLTAPFALLLASLGAAWVTYLITKKLFRVMFLKKVKTCLGDVAVKTAEDSIKVIGKLKKGNKIYDDAAAKLDQIKSQLLEKCGKK